MRTLAPWMATTIAVVAGTFYMLALREGAVHGYYTPSAVAMSHSLSNFLFGAADTAGFAGVDKIPGSLWPQALSVRLFGYSTWAVLIPEVLAATGTIIVLYLAVARWIGRPAGVIAAAVYACLPITAAVAQTNVPETWFALALTLAAYFAIRATQSGGLGWLVASGLAIAAGFQVKMLQSWTMWPAVILVYAVAAPISGRRRLWHLMVAGAVSLVASLSWVLLVSAVPSSIRPWVGGSNGNSAWEMVFGYNGLGRFGWWSGRSFVADAAGPAGLTRLIGPQLAVDLGWLIPSCIVALVAGLLLRRGFPRTDVQRVGWLIFGGWLICVSAPLILAGGIHSFYVLAYAPAMAALTAGGVLLAWRALPDRRGRWIVAAAILGQAAWTGWLVARAAEHSWLIGVVGGLSLLAAAVAVIPGGTAWQPARRWIVIAAALPAMLIAPMIWTLITLGPTSSINPSAGSVTSAGIGRGGAPGGPGMGPGGMGPGGAGPGGAGPAGAGTAPASSEVVSWLEEHDPGTAYLVAGESRAVSGLVIAGVRGVVALGGGFDGSDPTPTADQLAALVRDGQLSYVLSADNDRGPGGPGGMPGTSGRAGGAPSTGVDTSVATARQEWITGHCRQLSNAPTGLMSCTA